MANSNQIPSQYNLVSPSGYISQPWAFWFQQLKNDLPPAGIGYVIDGSATSYGPTTLYQGLDSDKGTPAVGKIYFATDTGKIYIGTSSTWLLESPAYTGDVSKSANSTILTLNNVNPAIGTWGDASNYPVVTVNAKGLVTNVTTEPIVFPPGLIPAGVNGSVQFNNAGALGGDVNLTYLGGLLTAVNEKITGQITFTNPVPTRTNLLPTQTGLSGYVLTTNGTDVSWKAAGPFEYVFHYGDATPSPLFTVPAGKLVLSVNIYITEIFNGTGPSLEVGDVSNYGSLMATTDNVPSISSIWSVEPGVSFGTDTPIFLSIVAGSGATTGAGLVIITIQE